MRKPDALNQDELVWRKYCGKLTLYDPNNPMSSLPHAPEYGPDSDFDITSEGITTNAALWKGSAQGAAALWKGKLISRRTLRLLLIVEGITFIPAALKRDKDFSCMD